MELNISVLRDFPKVNEGEVRVLLDAELKKNRAKIVVLDDDPTGVQTVHDISVYTDWSIESIEEGFAEERRAFYILTNSRGLTADETEALHREALKNICNVAKRDGREYLLISRSDSTLRGHYPLETEVIRDVIEANSGCSIDGEIICPFFKEGGRFTIGDVHYVKYGERLISANETEFARDMTFGYKAESLPEYVEEKTKGAYKAKDVVCITLDELRAADVDGIYEKLCNARDFGKIAVNAVDYADLEVFAAAFYKALNGGKRFVIRSAASLVRVLAGIEERDLLTGDEMVEDTACEGGLIVVGSHTAKTTAQLEALKGLENVEFMEIDVRGNKVGEPLVDIEAAVKKIDALIAAGKTVCCYTTRQLIRVGSGDPEDELKLSKKISEAVTEIVSAITAKPSFIVAKGGITSSDIGTHALRVRRAEVLGQIMPGIPVWRTGRESKLPGTAYVIFPGNVGEDDTLLEVVKKLQRR